LLLLDYWPLNRFRIQPQLLGDKGGRKTSSDEHSRLLKLITEKAPLLVLSGITAVITFLAQQRAGALSGLETVPLTWRIGNGLVSYVSYLGKMVWPRGLAVFYPHPANTLSTWKIALAGLLLVTVSIAVIKVAERYQYGLVGWFWYLGTLVPVIGFLQVGRQGMAERYTYIPLTGIFIIIAWGVAELAKGKRYKVLAVSTAAIMVLAALTVCSWHQVRYWKNSVDLFSHTLRVTAGNYVAHYTLANALAMQGSMPEALDHYKEALRIYPNYAEAHHNLANALTMEGYLDQAISHYKKALRIKPDYAEAHRNLGVAFDRQGRHEEAIFHYARALRINPDDAQSHNNLGVALAEQGKLGEANAHFFEALQIDPNHVEAQRNLQQGLELMGKGTAGSHD
jgi:Tfp pilus assembly protein PilF